MTKSFAPEVVADSSGKFCGNMLRFATREEAEASAEALYRRWNLCTAHRAVETTDPVNYKRENGRDVPL
jgi:hypothetical protein